LQSSSTIDASGSAAVNFTNTGSMGFNGGTAAKTLTLTGSNTGANTIAAVIGDNTGTTSVTKSGAGTWVLSGSNTYTGGTIVTAGTLLASNAAGSATGTGAVSVGGAGATVGGSGSLAGMLTVATLGTLSPGGSGGDSSLTLPGGQEWQSDGIYVWEISNPTTGAGIGWDLADSQTATLKISATPADRFTVQVVQSGAAAPAGTLNPNDWYVIAHAGAVTNENNVQIDPDDAAAFASLFELPTTAVDEDWEIDLIASGGGGYDVRVRPVPEPASVAALVVGAAGLFFRRRPRVPWLR
jgi:autotransporter-associated beta strand protein